MKILSLVLPNEWKLKFYVSSRLEDFSTVLHFTTGPKNIIKVDSVLYLFRIYFKIYFF